MTRKERFECAEEQLYIYSGILCHNQEFGCENREEILYDFSCPEYQTLKERYGLERIAGKGSDFQKAKRLLHYQAPRLTHSSWYDNHVPCNALDLLEYSLNNPEQGINCLNKSKILEECCLSLGIYARRVGIYPYSPYDFDNHVVTEIFDREMNKWIMLDPTTDGYFVDESKMPLSLLEIRDKFANDEFVTFVTAADRMQDLKKCREKNMETNAYICKNLFSFRIDRQCRFGATDNRLVFAPEHYSVKSGEIANMKFRIHNIPEEYSETIPQWESRLAELEQSNEIARTHVDCMQKSPIA